MLVLLGARGDADRTATSTADDADSAQLADRIVDAAFGPDETACALAVRLASMG